MSCMVYCEQCQSMKKNHLSNINDGSLHRFIASPSLHLSKIKMQHDPILFHSSPLKICQLRLRSPPLFGAMGLWLWLSVYQYFHTTDDSINMIYFSKLILSLIIGNYSKARSVGPKARWVCTMWWGRPDPPHQPVLQRGVQITYAYN